MKQDDINTKILRALVFTAACVFTVTATVVAVVIVRFFRDNADNIKSMLDRFGEFLRTLQ